MRRYAIRSRRWCISAANVRGVATFLRSAQRGRMDWPRLRIDRPCGRFQWRNSADRQLPADDFNQAGLQAEQFAGLASNTFSVNDAPGGYIDNPIVGTWLRVRYDDANNGQRPDRAEFFYARYRTVTNPSGPGPGPVSSQVRTPNRIDYQLLSAYAELLLFPRLSGFIELSALKNFITYPGIDPAGGFPNIVTSDAGLGDTIAGFKYLLHEDEDRYLTAQFKTYIPTGNSHLGLGTHHVSLEPGLLYLSRLSDRAYFQGELRYWIPVNGTDFAGNVLRYGAGFGYDLYQGCGTQSPLNPYVSNGRAAYYGGLGSCRMVDL